MEDASGVMIGVAVGAAVVTAFGVSGMRSWSVSRGVVDIPNERSSHDRPVPRGGGLVVIGVVLAGLAVGPLFSSMPWAGMPGLLGASLVAVVGWRDDIRSLPVSVRLLVQVLAAALVVVSGVSSAWEFPMVGTVKFGWAAPVLEFVLIVGLANAYNFMDGIDGIAGGQAFVAGVAWGVAGTLRGCRLEAITGALIAGAAVGFLVHNWPPARIFMGDVGSGTLGFLFAWLAVGSEACDPRLPIAGFIFVWPFIFDTVFTFFRRLTRRENVFQAHRSHLYQRLVIAGLSHRAVSVTYASLALLGAFVALWWLQGGSYAGAGLLIALPMAGAGLLATVLWKERGALNANRISGNF